MLKRERDFVRSGVKDLLDSLILMESVFELKRLGLWKRFVNCNTSSPTHSTPLFRMGASGIQTREGLGQGCYGSWLPGWSPWTLFCGQMRCTDKHFWAGGCNGQAMLHYREFGSWKKAQGGVTWFPSTEEMELRPVCSHWIERGRTHVHFSLPPKKNCNRWDEMIGKKEGKP